MNDLMGLMSGVQMPSGMPPMFPSVAAAKAEPVPAQLPPEASDPNALPAKPPEPGDNSKYYVDMIGEYKSQSENARQPHKDRWDICWDLFNNNYDFSSKADWQSKNFIPKIPTLVRKTTAVIKEALFSAKEFVRTNGYGDMSKAKAPMMNKLVLHVMDSSKFIDRLVEAIMAGLIMPGVNLKIYPKCVPASRGDSSEPGPASFYIGDYKNMICVDAVNELDLYRDPTGRDRYKIHVFEMDLEDLKEEATDPRNGYDSAAVQQISEDFSIAERDYAKAVHQNQTNLPANPKYRKRVSIEEYWGVIPNEDGKILYREGTMSRANGKYLIRKPMPKPYKMKRRDPFICGFVNKVPFSVWHESFIYGVTGIARMLTELLNLNLDANLFDAIKPLQVNIDYISDPNDLINGVFPGKPIKAEGAGGNPVVRPIELGGVSPEQQVVYRTLSLELENAASTSSFNMSIPTSKSETPTATQVRAEKSDDQLTTNDLARTIEREVIEPATDMIREMIVQYFDDFQDPAIMDLLGSDAMILAAAHNDAERTMLLGGNFYSTSRAITGLLQKAQDLQKYDRIASYASQFPAVAAMINVPGIVKSVTELLGLDPKEVLMLPEDMGAPGEGGPGAGPISPLASQLVEHRIRNGSMPPAAPDSGAPAALGGLLQ